MAMALNPQISNIVLGLILAGAIYTDLTSRRIPNLLLLLGIASALVWHYYWDGMTGLMFAVQGLGTGILLLVIPFILGGMGAGDVKLLGMIGAFKGAAFALETFIWMALVGGFLAVAFLIKEGQLVNTLRRLGRGLLWAVFLGKKEMFLDSADRKEFSVYFPYGVAIAIGALITYFQSW